MDTERIVEGVIGSIDTLGPIPPSARRLASRLHVAPATLYSSVPSLFDAYGQARAVVAEDFAGPLVAAFTGGGGDGLALALLASPNRATFVTDPSWQLPDTEALKSTRAGTDVTYEMMVDGLAAVGSLFSVDSLVANPPTGAAIEKVLRVYREAIAVKPTVSWPADAVSQVKRLAIELIAQLELDAVSESIQAKSLELIVSDTKWSFRSLRELTGLAVSRLHRYGSRIDHMARAYITFGTAAATWAGDNVDQFDATSGRLAVLLQTGAPEVMAELEHLRRCDPESRASAEQQALIDAIVGPQAAAIVTAQLTRGVDAVTVLGVGAAMGPNNEVPLAA